MKNNYNFVRNAITAFLIVCMGSLLAQPINPNGGFEESTTGFKGEGEITGWGIGIGGNAFGTFEIVDFDAVEGNNALAVEVTGIDANAWDVQIANEPFDVIENTEYTYSIWAMADVPGAIVNFTVGAPDYSEWGRAHQVAMSSEWQEITFTFIAPAGATTGRAPIHLAESANGSLVPIIFYIDDLQITTSAVGVESEAQVPTEFYLGQNYPNPFNPSTSINFSLPEQSHVTLVLYDVLGNIVKEIASGNYSGGTHTVELKASDLASGNYFYRITAGRYTGIKKLIVLK